MKKSFILQLIALFFFTGSIYGQATFKPGYVAYLDGSKEVVLIKDLGWRYIPKFITIKSTEEGNSKRIETAALKEIKIEDGSYFIRKLVAIDKSSSITGNLPSTRNPDLIVESTLLRPIVMGEVSLYSYSQPKTTKFFYQVENVEITELINRDYISTSGQVLTNDFYRAQLKTDLSCDDRDERAVGKTSYTEKHLRRLFIVENTCRNAPFVDHREDKSENKKINFSVQPGVFLANVTILLDPAYGRRVPYSGKLLFRPGFEIELNSSYLNNRLRFFTSPNFLHHKQKSTLFFENRAFVDSTILNINYSAVEIPLGLRYYPLTKPVVSLFIDASIGYSWYLTREVTYDDNSSSFELSPSNFNGYLGLGLMIKEKFTFSIKYQRDFIPSKFIRGTSSVNGFRLVSGYQL
ncbi:porin family protein [Neolewinella persica]|uniref:outer membrane beta-barrel protein n=1 Tax=Neolewinella persica TaxID=70998 RepID=UPI0003793291|nr:outer membrane beta-barrel protein [Neolewinella persica]